jgi:hypothetical protein
MSSKVWKWDAGGMRISMGSLRRIGCTVHVELEIFPLFEAIGSKVLLSK